MQSKPLDVTDLTTHVLNLKDPKISIKFKKKSPASNTGAAIFENTGFPRTL